MHEKLSASKRVFRKARWMAVGLRRLWLSRLSEPRLSRLADIPDPIGKRLSHILRKVRSNEIGESEKVVAEIEAKRHELLCCNEPLINNDNIEPGLYDNGQTIRSVCAVSKSQDHATLLHLLIREFQPLKALELGTNIGISSSYQAAALKMNGQGQLTTLEVSPFRMQAAKDLHDSMGLENVTYACGLFSETLDKVLEELESVDYAFIDGHHQMQATLDYFDKIWDHTSDNAIVVFDDIRWSGGMKRAWHKLKQDIRIKIAVDLDKMGICVTTRDLPLDKRYKTSVISI